MLRDPSLTIKHLRSVSVLTGNFPLHKDSGVFFDIDNTLVLLFRERVSTWQSHNFHSAYIMSKRV